ncbi:MAG: hypothetical protein IIV87_03175 [Oscillospiraceae bacterium]|nr:hypothetical protein [Oscillospiraceae bacterium]
MNKTRKILFRLGAAVLVALIIALMFWLGRGHTVYLDSKALDVDGVMYEPPYKITAYVDGEQVAKLYEDERGKASCIGQTFTVELEVMQEKGGSEETVTKTITLPYSMDGIILNLPGLLADLPADAITEEFVSKVVEEVVEEEIVIDEFAMTEG